MMYISGTKVVEIRTIKHITIPCNMNMGIRRSTGLFTNTMRNVFNRFPISLTQDALEQHILLLVLQKGVFPSFNVRGLNMKCCFHPLLVLGDLIGCKSDHFLQDNLITGKRAQDSGDLLQLLNVAF